MVLIMSTKGKEYDEQFFVQTLDRPLKGLYNRDEGYETCPKSTTHGEP
jgi:hypothetical protein